MSRNAAVAELSEVIRQINTLAERGERLALASGGLVSPGRFKTAQGCMTLAAGDLDEKGLLVNLPTNPGGPA